MSHDDSFDGIINRLRSRDDSAAAAVFHRFAHRLIALARKRLDETARRKEDPEDVVQSVFRSFFARFDDNQFEFASWDSLWTVLTLMTVRKCANRMEYLHAACRDVRREVSRESFPASPATWEMLATDPTPSQAAVLTEIMEQLMQGLAAPDRDIISLQLQGYTIPEMSAHTGRSERTVSRILERARKRLCRMRIEERLN
jgi:RNA polymerase sigma-70 factor (ECF subfamily)